VSSSDPLALASVKSMSPPQEKLTACAPTLSAPVANFAEKLPSAPRAAVWPMPSSVTVTLPVGMRLPSLSVPVRVTDGVPSVMTVVPTALKSGVALLRVSVVPAEVTT
jgi:hypothetical protein